MQRRHDIDALRVGAFGLLILYHVGMFYAGWDWHVKSSYRSEPLEALMLLVNQWRMPLLFLVSGLAVNFLLHKVGPREFIRRRLLRLGVPLLFGMAVVIPPQAYFQALANGAVAPGYLAFLARYFTFQGWPEGAFDGSDIGITWNHLWYLPYLLFYTLALLPLARWLDGRGNAWKRGLQALRGGWLMLLPVLPLMAWGLVVYPAFPYISHAFFDDGYAHAMYFTFFFYGYVLGRDPGLWQELGRLRKRTLGLALFAHVALTILFEIVPDDAAGAQQAGLMSVLYFNRWIWLVTVLGWGSALLNRPFRWLPYANEAVYPWYILHQTITVAAGFYLAPLRLGPVAEPVLMVGITVGGCLLLHEYLIRRIGWLRPLFGLKPGTGLEPIPRRFAHSELRCSKKTDPARVRPH
jgi:hypothetical protein